MKYFNTVSGRKLSRGILAIFAAALLLTLTSLVNLYDVSANHPVLVEGEQDFDGDGLLGVAEDTDSQLDRVFGTITASLGAANGGVNQNGRVTIVTSGRFPEVITITAANGNVTLEGAPGVDANIDAVLAGANGNVERQAMPGIEVNAPANRIVTIRNIMSRNWTDGIEIAGSSRVIVDNCRFENNINYGIHIIQNARATITNTTVTATGFRVSPPPVNNTPDPGAGIFFEDSATGSVTFTTVAGSINAGIANMTNNRRAVAVSSVNVFDNNPNFMGLKAPKTSASSGIGE